LGSLAVGGDGEGRAFDQRHEIGRLHPEMGSGLLLDPEGGPAPILEDLDESSGLRRRRQAEPGAGRDDHIFLSANEHRTGVRPGGDDVARLERGAPDRGRVPAAMLHLHRSRGLRHPPERRLGEGGMAPEEQEDDEGADEHGN
jgi:hypothetical protein